MTEHLRPTTVRWQSLRTAAVEIAFIAAAASMVYAVFAKEAAVPSAAAARPGSGRAAEPPLPTDPVSLEGMRLQGDERAKVILLEYGDYQCPYCGRFARETQPALEEKFVRTGQLRLAYRHMPLPNHRLAQKAAEAAECAAAQGKFWDMHRRLFDERPKLAPADLVVHARDLGLDTTRFEDCLGGRTADKVQADAALARQHAVTGTPTFFIGAMRPDGRVRLLQRLSGAQPAAAFETAIEKLIAAATASTKQ